MLRIVEWRAAVDKRISGPFRKVAGGLEQLLQIIVEHRVGRPRPAARNKDPRWRRSLSALLSLNPPALQELRGDLQETRCFLYIAAKEAKRRQRILDLFVAMPLRQPVYTSPRSSPST